MTQKKPRKEVLIRMNTRVSKEQVKFIKAEAKRLKISEGSALRGIIDRHIKSYG